MSSAGAAERESGSSQLVGTTLSEACSLDQRSMVDVLGRLPTLRLRLLVGRYVTSDKTISPLSLCRCKIRSGIAVGKGVSKRYKGIYTSQLSCSVPQRNIFTALGSRNSVRLSVRPSHACFVTNPKNLSAIFLYHMKWQSF